MTRARIVNSPYLEEVPNGTEGVLTGYLYGNRAGFTFIVTDLPFDEGFRHSGSPYKEGEFEVIDE